MRLGPHAVLLAGVVAADGVALPRESLLTKLRSFTSLRVVAYAPARDGYQLEIGPFPGWAEVPTW